MTTRQLVRLKQFSDEEVKEILSNLDNHDDAELYDLLCYLRWGRSVKSPYVDSAKIYRSSKKGYGGFRCITTQKDFNVTTNTIFHATKLSTRKQIQILLYFYNNKEFSQRKLSIDLDLSSSTVWRFVYKIRANENDAPEGFRANVIEYLRYMLRNYSLEICEKGHIKQVPAIRDIRVREPLASDEFEQKVDNSPEELIKDLLDLNKPITIDTFIEYNRDIVGQKLNLWQKFKISWKLFCGLLKS